MANIFSSLFGSKFPSTEKYENKNKHLREDLARFHELENSETISRYTELDTLVNSGEFKQKVDKLKKERFKDTEAFQQLRKYKEAKRSSNVKMYVKCLRNDKSEEINKLESTSEIKEYLQLKQFVESEEFNQLKTKKVIDENDVPFKKSDAYNQAQSFKKKKRSGNVKRYIKLLKIDKSKHAEELKETSEIKSYLKLKSYVESSEFEDIRTEMNDKNRFKKSKEFQLIEEYKTLFKSEDVVWFLKTKEHNPFKNIDKWNLTFEDDFDSPKLDENKWITGYYWGKALMNDNYVQANEKQFFKHENIELRDSCARIISKNESCKGKVWDAQFGFVPKDFEYSSGIISTGQSFRQQFGRFEAKIKFNHVAPAAHTFWLLSEKMTPQVNILKTPENAKNKFEAANFWSKDGQVSEDSQSLKIPGSAEEFFIYTLDWAKDKMVWKINGVTVHTITQNVPQEPMYISLSTHFTSEPKQDKLPVSMDIDWVRCYQLN
ncbi:glycoside hydrolase family 16 protein [Labilibacter marinus]|uniref:glycoside hydrolase family 16 protein n=1 Tax=Labilibacter marinus TaxID=1477105 RepID=UPI000830D0F9|nr:glycoside hydrolase family 16 protein [Labilibacter marinus]